MPDVVSNTTPLQYLHQVGRLDLLTRMYQRVIVPQAVADELRQGELQGIDVPDLDQLDKAGFYLRPEVRALVLRQAGETS